MQLLPTISIVILNFKLVRSTLFARNIIKNKNFFNVKMHSDPNYKIIENLIFRTWQKSDQLVFRYILVVKTLPNTFKHKFISYMYLQVHVEHVEFELCTYRTVIDLGELWVPGINQQYRGTAVVDLQLYKQQQWRHIQLYSKLLHVHLVPESEECMDGKFSFYIKKYI